MKLVFTILSLLICSNAFAQGPACFAEIINLRSSFEVPYDATMSAGHADGSAQSAYSNRALPESFQLNSTCAVIVKAVPVAKDFTRLTSTSGKFEHHSIAGMEISLLSGHNDAKVYLDDDLVALDTSIASPAGPHSAAHYIVVETQLGLDIRRLAAGLYNMNIELEIIEKP